MGKLLIIGIAVILVIVVLTIAIGTYFVNFAVHRKDSFNMNLLPPEERENYGVENERQRIIRENREKLAAYDAVFLENHSGDEVSILSSDNLELRASFYSNESHDYVILIHGYMGSRKDMISLASIYHSWGYNILSPDNRAHGESEGTWIGMGWLDKDDIRLWIDWIIDKDPDARICPTWHFNGSCNCHDDVRTESPSQCQSSCRRLRLYIRMGYFPRRA